METFLPLRLIGSDLLRYKNGAIADQDRRDAEQETQMPRTFLYQTQYFFILFSVFARHQPVPQTLVMTTVCFDSSGIVK
jgi:hypothetical protein